ncbi:MAG: tetratricopeptide repeat protein, partial [Rhodocyclaceae bacterium]|nr:tetratricopeptide repeat protein [Rhodocyclaceae bacterium]
MAFMQAEEATQLFAQAHHDFRGGKYDLACVALSRIQAAMGQHSGVLHLMALAEKGRGNLGAARAAFETAMQIAPDDGEIAANAANLFASMGDLDRALEAYAKAIAALPQRKDIVLNRSINLVSAGRGREAIGDLHEIGPHFSADARYWTVLGQAHQSIREIDEAVQCYERALAIEPMRAVALAALGALKLEQGDPTAVSTLRKAQRASDGRNDGENVLLLSEALESEGRTSEAISLMSEAVSSQPDWIAGLKSLARMQGEAGLPDAISVVFESAISAKPVVPVIWANYASLLRADDAPQAAIDVLERAKRAVGADGQLLLIEAGIAMDIGDTNRSREILDSLPPETPGLEPLRVRQAIRCGEPELGGRLAAGLLESAPDDIGLWALASLCWRMTNDPKEAWLNPGNGLYLATEIDLPAPIDQICCVL